MINKSAVFFLPIVLSLCILHICYPGFMSYDSIQMLEEARSSVRGGIFPTAPVYVLRFFDITGHGPTLMIQVQNFILLFSVTLVLRILKVGLITSTISLFALVAMPTVIGCMLVLWKDVTLTALIMLSLTIIFWASQAIKNDIFYKIAKWLALLSLMVGTLVKFNAITSTVIISIYWLSVFYKNKNFQYRFAAFFIIVISMIASNKIINGYSFPNFQKLETNNILYGVMANDLIGISGWSRVSLIPFDLINSAHTPKVPISDIDKIYSSLGSAVMYENNVKLGNIVTIFPEKYRTEDIINAWLTGVFTHPMAYISYRFDLFSEIIGAKTYGTYEPTHFNRIDENKFGIKFQERHITDFTLKYIEWASNVFFGKPWFIFLISFIAVLFIIKNPSIPTQVKMFSFYSFAAAFLYIIPFLLVTLSGEVRYSFTAIVLSSNSIFAWIFGKNPSLSLK
ncbi:MAG: hypothetical protein Q7V32_02825 [Methylicorpusculum sp.]|nr:hypothetical protein [Methylicorpusculum sp.]